MRRRQLFVYRYNDKPGDVMLINGSGRVVVVPPYDVAGRVADGFTPYGIVVVPTSHDTYGDGTMGVMSIKNTGYIPFGPYGHDPVFDRFQFEVDNPEGKGQNAILDNVGPIQKKDDILCPLQLSRRRCNIIVPATDFITDGIESCNPALKYRNVTRSEEYSVAPNIYNVDGSMNPLCRQNDGNWFIFDYDGFGNTRYIYQTYGSKWSGRYGDGYQYHEKVDVDNGQYPMIEMAVNFDVKGRWYLPGLGEMQYIVARYAKIKESLEIIARYSYSEPILDSYMSSTIINTRYLNANDDESMERDRCSGFWFENTINSAIPDNSQLTSFGDDKNRTHRGRFMCRYSYRYGFKNMLG